jgi:hypothetical protein
MTADTRSYTARVAAGGTAVATIRVQDGINTWTVNQVSIKMATAPDGSTTELQYNGRMVTPMIPTGDVADGSPPVILRPADVLTVNWAGCTPGDVGEVLVFYDDGRPA